MTGSIAWTAEQIRAMRPLRARAIDTTAEVATWVCALGRRITYHDVMRQRECGRYHAMRVLREAAERGLLVRYRARGAHEADQFGPPTKCIT